jgi:hypothetical protein
MSGLAAMYRHDKYVRAWVRLIVTSVGGFRLGLLTWFVFEQDSLPFYICIVAMVLAGLLWNLLIAHMGFMLVRDVVRAVRARRRLRAPR